MFPSRSASTNSGESQPYSMPVQSAASIAVVVANIPAVAGAFVVLGTPARTLG